MANKDGATPDCCVIFRCPHQGKTIAEHCAAGWHCINHDAGCAAAAGVNDHQPRCCTCNVTIEERAHG